MGGVWDGRPIPPFVVSGNESMADLAEITGAPDAETTVASLSLSPWDFRDYGTMEREWEAKRIARSKVTADGLGRIELADRVIARAEREIADGMFAFGSPWFDAEVLKVQNAPFLVWLSARHDRPHLKRDEVETLFTTKDPAIKEASEAAHSKVLALGGYGRSRKRGETENVDLTDPSTGGASSDSPMKKGESPLTESADLPLAESTPL